MADLEAKRAARRKRILENSENRLKKISGVESRVTRTELDGIKFHTSSEEVNQGTISKNLIEGNGDHAVYEEVHAIEKNLETIFQNPRISLDEDSVSQMSATQSRPRQFYILVLPLLINLLLALCDIFHIDTESIYMNKIFLPLIAYEIYEYIFTPNVQFSNSIISSVILLSNKPYSRQINLFVRYFLRTVQDVMIYFFVFMIFFYNILRYNNYLILSCRWIVLFS